MGGRVQAGLALQQQSIKRGRGVATLRKGERALEFGLKVVVCFVPEWSDWALDHPGA